jgi:hypothetical protein
LYCFLLTLFQLVRFNTLDSDLLLKTGPQVFFNLNVKDLFKSLGGFESGDGL